MNQINVVPFIDVMLVLLIVFMVAAPLINPGQIELPTVGQQLKQPIARHGNSAAHDSHTRTYAAATKKPTPAPMPASKLRLNNR